MASDLKKTVARNILSLMGKREGERGSTAALIKMGFSNGDATRILKGHTSLGLDKLAQIAAALKVER